MGFTRVGIQVDRLPQARTRPAPDRRPALALAVLGDQAVRHRRSVQRVLDLGLLERARRDPAAQRPGCAVERVIPPWPRGYLEVADHSIHVRLAAAPIATGP